LTDSNLFVDILF